MSDRRTRQALRQLDEKRLSVRLARFLLVTALLYFVAVVTGWTAAIMLLSGGGLVAAITGLLLLTVAGIAAVGGSFMYAIDCRQELRKAQYAYEDAVLEAGK